MHLPLEDEAERGRGKGKVGLGWQTYPLYVSAIPGKFDHTVGVYPSTVRNVKTLQSPAVLGNGEYGLLCDLIVAGDVEG